MKPQIKVLFFAWVWFSVVSAQLSSLFAQGTAFTYQGRFNTNSVPYTGSVEFQFTLWDAVNGGSPVATNNPASLIASVNDGLFLATLDFGSNPFNGQPRFLQVEARTSIGAFTTLTPRQPLTPTPYALRALNLATNGLAAGAYASAVTFNNAGNSFAGAFNGAVSGNGVGLTGVNAALLGGLSSANFWRTNGNTGANPANGAFLGTTDTNALEFRVNGQRVLRIEHATNAFSYSPNLVGGYSGNIVSNGFAGTTIGGGGDLSLPNRVGNDFATVVGGQGNTAIGLASTAMGAGTTARGYYSTAMGQTTSANGFGSIAMGVSTLALGDYSTAMGNGTKASGLYSTAMGDGTTASGHGSFAMGGNFTTASGTLSIAMGSSAVASGYASTALGDGNIASGDSSIAMGVNSQASGDGSVAMGQRAHANHKGSFVWADSSNSDFSSTRTNQFLVRASGGMQVLGGTAQPALNFTGARTGGLSTPVGLAENTQASGQSAPALRVVNYGGNAIDGALSVSANGTGYIATFGNAATTVSSLTINGTWSALAFNPTSDRNAKENFSSIDPSEVLAKVAALSLERWNYKAAPGVEHIGPVAQDFHAAFGLNGDDDKHIATVDADGVALAAIQGLNQKLEEQRAENTELKARLEKLERLMNHKNRGDQ